MLHLLDDGIAAFLRAELGTSANGLDIVFTAPDREWSARLSRPTINCYLWGVTPAAQGNVSGFEQVVDNDRTYRRPASPRVDLRYLITAWADDAKDEHMVLGAVLRLFARPRQLEADFLPAALASVTPFPQLQLAGPSADDRADFWNALGGHYRPGLDLRITAAIDMGDLEPLALPPTHVRVAVADRQLPERRSVRDWFRRAG